MQIALRSLCSDALSSEALKNFPLIYDRAVIFPATGMRCKWTLKMERKIEMRQTGLSPKPKSTGGGI